MTPRKGSTAQAQTDDVQEQQTEEQFIEKLEEDLGNSDDNTDNSDGDDGTNQSDAAD